MSPSLEPLTRLLNPDRVVVVGASESTGNRGGQAIGYLRKFGFAGAVTPVHPSGGSVHGYDAVRSLDDLDEPADVALVAVGATRVRSVVSDLGRSGVATAIVWAGGFAEVGQDGMRLQRELAVAARQGGVRLLGPNCLGFVNTSIGFCGTFASWLGSVDTLVPGHISMVTQSGGLGAAAHAAAQNSGVGFRFMASTGNEADISAVEMLELFADDEGSRVICCYLEGVAEGRRLVAALERARAQGKDVVVLKGGRSASSARAAAAHTGAMAGQARVWDAVLKGVGATQVYSVEELVEVSTVLAASWGKSPPRGNRVAIVGYGGGPGVLAADQCSEVGLRVLPLSDATQRVLRPLVPEIASLRNPVDLTPEAFNQNRYRHRLPEVLRELDRSDEIDVLLLQAGAMSRGADDVARAICEFHRASAKRLAIYWPAAPESARAIFAHSGVHVFDNQPAAVATLARIVTTHGARSQPDTSAVQPKPLPVDVPKVTPGQVIGEHAVHDMLRAAGLSTLDGRLAVTADDAVRTASSLGLPVAMKIVSDQITHRAAAGLVRLGVASENEVRARFEELVATAAAQHVEVTGVYVQKMCPSGTEFLVSAFCDESFGAIVSVGAGGVHTELFDDVAFALAPLGPASASALVQRLRVARLLQEKGDTACLGPLSAFLVELSRLAAALPWAAYVLEVNPVVVTADHAVALDGLLVIEEP